MLIDKNMINTKINHILINNNFIDILWKNKKLLFHVDAASLTILVNNVGFYKSLFSEKHNGYNVLHHYIITKQWNNLKIGIEYCNKDILFDIHNNISVICDMDYESCMVFLQRNDICPDDLYIPNTDTFLHKMCYKFK